MIDLAEFFACVGQDGCLDVASSLTAQGCDGSTSIPIFEAFYAKILIGDSVSFVASSLKEFNALRRLANECGAVSVTLNLLDIDQLTLLAATLIATPGTGMNIFLKECITNILDITEEVANQVIQMAGIPIDASNMNWLLEKAISVLFDKLVTTLQESCDNYGINVYKYEQLPEYCNHIYKTGELQQMKNYRIMNGAPVF